MKTSKKLLFTFKRLFFLLLISFIYIGFWRGIWGLMDEYIFPANYKLSIFIPLILSILILFFFPRVMDEL